MKTRGLPSGVELPETVPLPVSAEVQIVSHPADEDA
jgi:hypothetical protein